MNAASVWGGLGESAFLADYADREREPARVIVVIIGGLVLGLLAGALLMVLIVAAYVALTGGAHRGAAAVLAAIASLADDRASAAPGASVFRLAVLTLVNAASMVGFVIFAAVLMKRPLRRYVTAAPHVRWRLLVVGMGLAALATAPLVIAERLLTGGSDPIPVLAISPMLGDRLLYLASSLLLIPAAAAEELLFRGWLVRQVGTLLRRPVMLISVSGLLFSAAHFDFAPDAFLLRAVMGGSFAYMTLRLGGIELACGAHAVNNMMILLFLAPLSLHPEPAGDLSGLSLLRDVALVGGYVLITEIVARVGIVRAMAGVRDGEISPSWGVAAGVV